MKISGKQTFRILLVTTTIVATITGCTTNWQPPPPSNQSHIKCDPLSYGMVTAKVKKGTTNQDEIMRIFGAPNITTINKDGREVWMYDRISTVSQSDSWSEARRFSIFFGLETFNTKQEMFSSKQGGSRASTTSTLTVIITFDTNKHVIDYSARATQF